MKTEEAALLRDLLRSQRVLTLAVEVDEAPFASLLPFAATEKLDAVYIHASSLARHARGLRDGTSFGIVIHLPDRFDADPLQIPRVTLQGAVQHLERGSDEYLEGRDVFTGKFPRSEATFSLGDFQLYRLTLEKGRLIAGFARAVNLFPDNLRRLTDGD